MAAPPRHRLAERGGVVARADQGPATEGGGEAVGRALVVQAQVAEPAVPATRHRLVLSQSTSPSTKELLRDRERNK